MTRVFPSPKGYRPSIRKSGQANQSYCSRQVLAPYDWEQGGTYSFPLTPKKEARYIQECPQGLPVNSSPVHAVFLKGQGKLSVVDLPPDATGNTKVLQEGP